MQQEKFPRPIINRLQRHRLFGVERQRLGGHDFLIGIGIALGNLRGNFNQALVLELANGWRGCAGNLQQLLQRQRAGFLDHLIDLQLAFGQFPHAVIARQQPHVKPFSPAFLLLAHRIGQHTLEGGLRRAAIILGNPAGQFEHSRRHQRLRANDFGYGLKCVVIRLFSQTGHAPEHLSAAERHLHTRAHLHPAFQFRRDQVVKLPAQGDFQCDTRDHAPPSRSRSTGERLMN